MSFEHISPTEESEKADAELSEPQESEIDGDRVITQFEKPSIVIETRPAGGGDFEMLVQIGREERVVPLGGIDYNSARHLHREAVDFLRGRLPGIEAVAQATADALARQIEKRLGKR